MMPSTQPPTASKSLVEYRVDDTVVGIGEIPLRDLVHQELLIIEPDSSLRSAMFELNRVGSQAGIVALQRDMPLGVITLHDLVNAITIFGADLNDPVFRFMTAAPISLPADSPAHRGKIALTRGSSRYVVLVESDGRILNLLSSADLPGFREGGAEALVQRIQLSNNVDSMAKAAVTVRQRGRELYANGMGVEALTQWMSGLNDLLSIRVIELIADEFDLPPVPWCWMAFGSEGRLEQTFATDQDNGLIFQPEKETDAPRIRAALLAFAAEVNKALDHCGFALCRGNVMASNPDLCLSTSEWEAQFKRWLGTPDPKALLNSTIFFDLRPLYGQNELVDDLRQWLLPLPSQHPRFLRAMAEEALKSTPSLLWPGFFSYDGGTRYPHTIDLKKRGSRLFVDAARIWALKYGLWSTNTVERLRMAGANMQRAMTDTIGSVEAFDYVQRLRINRQMAGGTYDEVNRVNPKHLSATQRQMMKEAFRQAKSLQLKLRQEFLD